jgi:hypothetical protein
MIKNPSAKEIIKDVLKMRNLVIRWLDKSKKYYPIFKALTDKDYYNSEDLAWPNIKELSEMTGISYYSTRKLLVDGYIDMYYENFDHPIEIQNLKYNLILKGYEDTVYIEFGRLPILPRIGENITVSHFKALVGTDYFYVDEIRHEIRDDNQTVTLVLKVGIYNIHKHYQKDKAEVDRRDRMFKRLDL